MNSMRSTNSNGITTRGGFVAVARARGFIGTGQLTTIVPVGVTADPCHLRRPLTE